MKVSLESSQQEAERIRTFWFRPQRPLRYTVGQFIELYIPHEQADKRGQKRWFSLSSSPSEELLSITTKFAAGNGSTFKQALAALEPGMEVSMSEAMGDFVLPKDITKPLVFVAGGIGVTPMRSMIKWLYDTQQHRTIQLIYAARRIEEVAFRQLFADYGLPVTINLSDPPTQWEGETGTLDAAKILALAPDADSKLYYLSGPEPMVETLFKDLKANGVDKRRLVTDYFPGYVEV